MRIIEIAALSNGAHRNQTPNSLMAIPDGWAVTRDGEKCKNFPFGNFEIEWVDGVPHMKEGSWIPGVMPEPEPEAEAEPTAQDDTDSMLVDHEYRITLLELGLTE